jgi:hypothetical protein
MSKLIEQNKFMKKSNLVKISVVVLLMGGLLSSIKKKYDCKCELIEIKTMHSEICMHVGVDTSYGNDVLIKEFTRECMDSLMLLNICLKYIDTAKTNKRISVVAFYNSDKKFAYNQSSQLEEVWGDCLVTIAFERKTKNPEFFVFYNDLGEIIYWGPNWRPKGE